MMQEPDMKQKKQDSSADHETAKPNSNGILLSTLTIERVAQMADQKPMVHYPY